VMAAPSKSTSLWSRLGLQATKTPKQPLVYSTKARVTNFLVIAMQLALL